MPIRPLLALALVAALATPALAAKPSCPIPGDSQQIIRLAWVDSGKYMRSGTVVVAQPGGLAQGDAAAVLVAYQKLRQKYHVGAVINLRAEANEDEAACKAAGIRYLHLPIEDGAAPTPTQVSQFFGFLKQARTRKVVALWHCAGGIGRTGVLAGMLRLREGWTTKAAADEMFGMGLNYDQAVEDLPALNAFAAAMGKPGYYPADWRGPRQARFDYRAIVKKLPKLD